MEAAAFVNTVKEKQLAETVEAAAFVNMTKQNIDAKTVLDAIVNTVKSNLGVRRAKHPQKPEQHH